MNQKRYFIVSPTWVDFLTLGSLWLACLGLFLAYYAHLSLAIVFMLMAMFVDMFDGLLARRLKLESEFGKQLDSFCDVFTYLVLPLYILFQMGMNDLLSLTILFIYLVCGLLRLSKFNLVGVIEAEGSVYHLGLQVIWSHLFVVLAFPIWLWLDETARYILIPILLLMSIFMISNLRFPKPTRYLLQTFIILFVTIFYFYLHLIGVYTP
ncbi:MAG: CDP-alcohol phosphatidyltransferase family protein [Anaerolineae bacterium]|nr:CDP-alcohol phosphatidyltransferase family protein [Anaerolineae bacterium]